MSNTQFAFIERARVPDRAALQASVDALGFGLKVHPAYTPFEDSGFLPFVLNGEDGFGFEISYQDASEIIGDDQRLRDLAAGRNHCISMVWHSSMKDLACVMIVSCALTKDFGAVVSYEGDPPEPLEKMLASTQEILTSGADEKPPTAKLAPSENKPLRQRPWWKFW